LQLTRDSSVWWVFGVSGTAFCRFHVANRNPSQLKHDIEGGGYHILRFSWAEQFVLQGPSGWTIETNFGNSVRRRGSPVCLSLKKVVVRLAVDCGIFWFAAAHFFGNHNTGCYLFSTSNVPDHSWKLPRARAVVSFGLGKTSETLSITGGATTSIGIRCGSNGNYQKILKLGLHIKSLIWRVICRFPRVLKNAFEISLETNSMPGMLGHVLIIHVNEMVTSLYQPSLSLIFSSHTCSAGRLRACPWALESLNHWTVAAPTPVPWSPVRDTCG